MWKRFLLAILIIVGCENMATKYNDYTVIDPNPGKIIPAIDMDGKGLIRLSLTNWDNTSKPNVAQESIVEVGGARFKTDTDGGDVISLTDPVTSSTVADGDVYIVINGDSASGGYGSYYFTATAPTWSDTKQGYYLTGLYDDYRAVGGCYLDSGIYTEKYVYNKNYKIFSILLSEYSEKISTEKSVIGISLEEITPTFSITFNIEKDNIYEIIIFGEIKHSKVGTRAKYFVEYNTSSTGIVNATFPFNFVTEFIYEETFNPLTSGFNYCTTDELVYSPYLLNKKVFAISSGTLAFKEYLGAGEAGETAYVRNRNIYIRKINNISLNK